MFLVQWWFSGPPGSGATGHGAGLVSCFCREPLDAQLVRRSAALYEEAGRLTAPLFRRTGLYVLASRAETAAALSRRAETLLGLGLGYLSLDRATPTLSPGELQRLRLATQIRSKLFGVVYVLDEPSAGLHPADAEALFDALDSGTSAAGAAMPGAAYDETEDTGGYSGDGERADGPAGPPARSI